jgi:hypothetical protein
MNAKKFLAGTLAVLMCFSLTACAKPLPAVLVTGVTLDKTQLELPMGKSERLTAAVAPDDAANKGLVWSSSDESVVTVTDGTVTAVAEGQATVKAASAENSALFDMCAITVFQAGVVLNKNRFAITTGETETLTATALNSTGSRMISWSSSDESVVTVTDGTVTAVAEGQATVKAANAADPSAYAECAVEVTPPYDAASRTALNSGEIPYTFPVTATYSNNIALAQLNGRAGDPFVMRWNGKYYLFPSNDGAANQVKGYTSDDMVHWDGGVNVVNRTTENSNNFYAPEIIYFKGVFYMCSSSNGQGHFLYKSTTDSPLGPYEMISGSGNVGRGIDGSFYVRDDGKLFLMHTNINPSGLRMSEVLDIETATLGEQVLIEGANLNHWIEGPGAIRRDDITYLTYCGNHISSRGYRIAYSYTTDDIITPDSFIQPSNNVNLISTVPNNFYGLGHSSNAYGPNLDSIYTAYHSQSGSGRRYSLDRYLTNGIRLTANGMTYTANGADVPSRPDFEATLNAGLETSGAFLLSGGETGAYYTAEFNYFISGGAAVLNYADAENYQKVTINAANDTLRLHTIKNGGESVTASAVLPVGNKYDKLTVLRVEKTLDRIDVFYNGMKVLTVEYVGGGGKIGYTDGAQASYTAFTNDVLGTSDFDATKNLPARIPAHTYLKGENRGFYFARGAADEGPRMDEKNTVTKENGQYSVTLSQREDFVKYAVRAQRSGAYSLAAEVGRGSEGAIIEAVVGESTIYRFEVPRNLYFGGDDHIAVSLGTLSLDGKTTIKLRLYRGVFNFRQLQFFERGIPTPIGLEGGTALNGAAGTNYETATLYRATNGNPSGQNAAHTVADGALVSPESRYSMLLGGAPGASNFEFETDVAILGAGGNEGGIVFRAKHYSTRYNGDAAEQPLNGFQGYYFNIQERIGVLIRNDYGAGGGGVQLAQVALRASDGANMFAVGNYVRVKVRCENNRILIWADGTQIIDVYDNGGFMDGQAGFYSRNKVFGYKSFIYRAL